MPRTTRLIGSLVIGTVALGAMAASASAQPASTSIGPNQAFVGLVNGKHPTATVTVACPGPARQGQTGHPVGSQTIGFERAPSTATSTGSTGSRGKSIVATFGTSKAVTFTNYGTSAIPTIPVVPCSGTGPVIFTPQPKGKGARSTTVTVTYENIAVSPTAPLTTTTTHTITITWADHGKSFSLHKGDRLDVELTGSPSVFTWTEPTSSNSAALKRLSGSSGQAVFSAVGSGKAMVTAVGNPKCYPQCLIASILFEVKVTVTG